MGTVWAVPTLATALRLVFQSLLCEETLDTAACFQRVWALLLRCGDPRSLAAAAGPWVGAWCGLLATPVRPPPHIVQQEVLQHTQCTDIPQHTGAHHPI
jgi:hypothetical protein